MDFKQAVQTCLNKYATFTGRAQRSEFWWFVLFNFIGSIVLNTIDTTMFGMPALSVLWTLGLLIPGIAVSIRRMHDLDKSGWWILIPLVPIVGIILYIYWAAQRGTVGSNQYGPDPLAGQGYATA